MQRRAAAADLKRVGISDGNATVAGRGALRMNGEGPRQGWEISRDEWRALSLYGRFEQLITWVLAAMIGLVVCVAAFRLASDVVRLLLVQALNPLEHEVLDGVRGDHDRPHRARVQPQHP